MAQQLLARYGIVLRETAASESLPGGFSAIYEVMKGFENSGRVRRGYFVADLGATQFALPAAAELLRSLRADSSDFLDEAVILAATDPANPYGALLRWPILHQDGVVLNRSVGSRVVLIGGALTAYLRRGKSEVHIMLPREEPALSLTSKRLAEVLVISARHNMDVSRNRDKGLLISRVNGVAVQEHPLAKFLLDAGFRASPRGFVLQRNSLPGSR